ncbi:MAG: histidine kinase dimerization/phospho-acceptor domain-containing protein [Thermoleophilaceae bacterium]
MHVVRRAVRGPAARVSSSVSPSAHRGAPRPPRATLPVILLALTVALGAALAYEARSEIRSHRETAERALRDYAAGQARGALAQTVGELSTAVVGALAPAIEGTVASPYDLLPPPEVIAVSSADVLRCPGRPATDSGRVYFRLDLRDNTLALYGPPAGVDRRWLADAVTAHARSQYRPGAPFATLASRRTRSTGGGALSDQLVVYSVKYAPHQAPSPHTASSPAPPVSPTRCSPRGGVRPPIHCSRSRAWEAMATSCFGRRHGTRVDGRAHGRLAGRGEHQLARGAHARRRAADRRAAGRPARAPAPSRIPHAHGRVGRGGARAVAPRARSWSRLRADFTSSVSHELRTPLAQILLFGETLALDRVRSPDERRAAAETIVQEARRLLRLVENVLHFAQAERGAVQLDPHRTAARSAALVGGQRVRPAR